MLHRAHRLLRRAVVLSVAGVGSAVLTLVLQRVQEQLTSDAADAGRNSAYEAGLTLLGLSSALIPVVIMGFVFTGLIALSGLFCSFLAQREFRKARALPPNPADPAALLSQVVSDTVGIFRQLHEDLSNRSQSVERAEKELARQADLASLSAAQAEAVQDHLSSKLSGQLRNGTRLAVLGLVLAVLLLVVGHYWR